MTCKKNRTFQNLNCEKIPHFDKPAAKKSESFTDFWQNNRVFMQPIANTCTIKKKKKDPRENCVLPIFGEIFLYLIQKSNARKCYILVTLIVKRLEFNRFREVIMYLCNQPCTHTKLRISKIQLPKKNGDKRTSFVGFRQNNCFFKNK